MRHRTSLVRFVAAAVLLWSAKTNAAQTSIPTTAPSFEEYLRSSVVPRETLDQWLKGNGWVIFDPELGYVLGNSLMPWGIDNTATIETIQKNGARTSIMYADKPPRINTYGDSFTESNQVSDGETWQEYLAGHLGEPVANFGVGGYGVYQAYRRMLREEMTEHGAKYLILTICCDDSTRSLYRYRRAVFFEGWPEHGGMTFHGNFWSNLEMDLKTGRFIEKPQLLPTKESLYRMTEPNWMVEHLRDDWALQLTLFSSGRIRELNREKIDQLAKRLDFPFDWTLDAQHRTVPSRYADYGAPEMTPMQAQAAALLNRYSQRATIFILQKARTFVQQHGKELLIVLNGNASIDEMKQRGTREDQELVDYLVDEKVPFVDMNAIFLKEFRKSALSAREFMARYLVNGAGHFNPMGNHFIAYSIKDVLVPLVDPKPLPYQQPDARAINFRGYLRGGLYQDPPAAVALDPHFLTPPDGAPTIGNAHGDIAVSPTGEIYVSVEGGPHPGIQVYSAHGRYLRNVPNAPTDLHGFIIGKAPDGTANIFGASLQGQRIIQLTLDGREVLSIPASLIPDRYKRPYEGKLILALTGITVAPSGDIYVVDGYSRDFIHRFDKRGRYIASFGGPDEPWNFKQCHKIAIDPRFDPVRLLCTDRLHDRLISMNLDGGNPTVVVEGLRWPSALSVFKDELAVAELGGRVSILDIAGKRIASIGANENTDEIKTNEVPPEKWRTDVLYAPHGITYDAGGNLLVTEWSKWGRVVRVTRPKD